MYTLYTCGHGTRSFQELIDLLQQHGITVLVDVRATPQSRFHPQFNRRHIVDSLPLQYLWLGDRLGGKNAKQTPPELFADGIETLLRLCETETVCIMCSERVPTPTKWRPQGCHRWSAITPVLESRGVKVVHV